MTILREPLRAKYTIQQEKAVRDGWEHTHLQAIIEVGDRLEKRASDKGVFLRMEAVGFEFSERNGQIAYNAIQGVPWWEQMEILGGVKSGMLKSADRAGQWTTGFPFDLKLDTQRYRRRGINSETGRYVFTPIVDGDDENWEKYL